MHKALVFSIEEFSIYDGPGIRISVFLKGCPLRCSWCHNPEGQDFDNGVIRRLHGCTGCGACKDASDEEKLRICPNGLYRRAAELYTPQTLVEKLEGNFDILNSSGGGITFSGGEPLCHEPFLEECLNLLRGRVHTAVQTSGFADGAVFDRILRYTDYMLFDLKLADPAQHLRYTGVGNEQILRNFSALVQSGVPFTPRTPLIPGVTDTVENLTGIAEILRKNKVDRIELLPYNTFAGGKYAAAGKVFIPDFDETIPPQPHTDLFEAYGIHAVTL